MKSYIEYFEPGGVVIPDKHVVKIKDSKGNETGAGFIKNDEFIIIDSFKNALSDLKNKISTYYYVKKNLPKVNENSTPITTNQTINAIKLARNGQAYYNIPLKSLYSDLNSSTNF